MSGSEESHGGTGQGKRVLRGGGLDDGRDFPSSGTRPRSFAFIFASTGSSIGSNSLVKHPSATINDICVHTIGRRGSGLLSGVTGHHRRGVGVGAVGPLRGGVRGGGSTEEKGVGRRTGGATRRDRSETELRRSRFSLPIREFVTWERESWILIRSSFTRRPMEFSASTVEHRRGRRTDSPRERDWRSWGVSEETCWAERDPMRRVPSR